VALLFVLRHYVWLMFASTVFGGLVIARAALQIFNRNPVLGALMTIAGAFYVALIVRTANRRAAGVGQRASSVAIPSAQASIAGQSRLSPLGNALRAAGIAIVSRSMKPIGRYVESQAPQKTL
jgi:hypothetical protein